jgi:hypothetical protein
MSGEKMSELIFPILQREAEGRFQVANTPCLACGQILNDKKFPRLIYLNFSTVLMETDSLGMSTDDMDGAVHLGVFDFTKDEGAALTHATDIRGGDTDFCFCSTACCRSWLNKMVDALERKALASGYPT